MPAPRNPGGVPATKGLPVVRSFRGLVQPFQQVFANGVGTAVGEGIATATAILVIAGSAIGIGNATGNAQLQPASTATGIASASSNGQLQGAGVASGIAVAT